MAEPPDLRQGNALAAAGRHRQVGKGRKLLAFGPVAPQDHVDALFALAVAGHRKARQRHGQESRDVLAGNAEQPGLVLVHLDPDHLGQFVPVEIDVGNLRDCRASPRRFRRRSGAASGYPRPTPGTGWGSPPAGRFDARHVALHPRKVVSKRAMSLVRRASRAATSRLWMMNWRRCWPAAAGRDRGSSGAPQPTKAMKLSVSHGGHDRFQARSPASDLVFHRGHGGALGRRSSTISSRRVELGKNCFGTWPMVTTAATKSPAVSAMTKRRRAIPATRRRKRL